MPVFLGLDEVLEIHGDQIERYGGSAGVRDMGLLQAALAMPEAGSRGRYFHVDLFEMAAAYLFHLVKDHPFVDGNKRVALASALVFLEMNRVEVSATNEALVSIVLGAVEGTRSKAAIAEFMRKHAGS